MDPSEQKTTHSYPNADRSVGDNGSMPSDNAKPLVHISDVISSMGSKPEDKSYKTSTVHTFKDDMASEASKGNFSIGKIMVANSKRIHESSNNVSSVGGGGESKNWLVRILVPIISILIIGGFAYAGFKFAKTPTEITLQNNPDQQVTGGILYSEQNIGIDVKGKSVSNLYKEIQTAASSDSASSGKIKSIVLNYQDGTSTIQLSSVDFLNIVAPGAPDSLLRNLKKEYVFGYYSSTSEEPFIILKSANYDSTFAGMLEWERNMYADLGDLIFKKESLSLTSDSNSQSTTESDTSTTSSAPTSTMPSTGATANASEKATAGAPSNISNTSVKSEYDTAFVDKIISNNDTRVLYRPNGNIAFFYTFFNKDTIIIATSEVTLHELIYRLTSGKITR